MGRQAGPPTLPPSTIAAGPLRDGSRNHRSARLLKGASASFVIKMLGAGIAVLVHMILARLMGEDQYGTYVYVWTWITLGVPVATLGFTTSSIRFVAEYRGQRSWGRLRGFIRTSRRAVLAASVATAAFVVGLAWYFTGGPPDPLFHDFALAAVALPLFVRMQVSGGGLRGLQRVVHGQSPQYVFHPLLVLVFFGLLVGWGGQSATATWALAATLAASAVGAAVSEILLEAHMPREVRQADPVIERPRWLKASLVMVLFAGFHLLMLRTDTLMVGALLGTTEAGIYSVASRIAGLLAFSLVAVNAMLAPMAAELHAGGSREDLQGLVVLGARAGLAISSTVAVLLLPSHQFALGLFGTGFTAAAGALWILVVGQLLSAVAGPAIMLLNMTGYENDSAKILGLVAAANVGLNLVLIPRFGMEGAATATTVSLGAWTLLAVMAVQHRLGIGATAFSGGGRSRGRRNRAATPRNGSHSR